MKRIERLIQRGNRDAAARELDAQRAEKRRRLQSGDPRLQSSA